MARSRMRLELEPFDPPALAPVCPGGPDAGPALGSRCRLELVDLDAEAVVPVGPSSEPEGMPPPSYSEEELAAAVAAARAEAVELTEGRVRDELAKASEQRMALALEVIARAFQEVAAADRRMVDGLSRTTGELALAMARAVVPRALERAPLADIAGMLREVVSRLEGEPVLELRLPEDLVEPGRLLMDEIGAEAGYRGTLEVRAERGMSVGDARLLWRHGKAERRVEVIVGEAEALARTWLDAELPRTAVSDEETEGAVDE